MIEARVRIDARCGQGRQAVPRIMALAPAGTKIYLASDQSEFVTER